MANNDERFLRGDQYWDAIKRIPLYYDKSLMRAIETEFLTGGLHANPPWSGAALATGTTGSWPGEINHPGITFLRSSSSANSGYRYTTSFDSFLISCGEQTELIFQAKTTTNLAFRFGFFESGSIATPNFGAWIKIDGTTLTGETSNAAVAAT